MPPPDIIIISLDNGTTYSGSAWTRANSTTISLVTSWECSESLMVTEVKVPSKMFLEKGSPTDPSDVLWGYNVPLGKQPVEWFKIKQLDDDDVPEHIKRAPKYFESSCLLKDLEQTPSSVLATFFKCLWSHTRQSIERSVGAACLESCDLHFVMTIPASWPHYVKERYKAAAEVAGMLDRQANGRLPKLSFISEPEAGALATLQDLANQPEIKDGDSFITCDAGGGTVDVITYMIKDKQLREVVEGEGALCGAMNLDHGFRALMKNRLVPGSFEALDPASEQKFLKYEWHSNLKQAFQETNSDRKWIIDLPHGCHERGNLLKRKTTLSLTSEEIKEGIFEPVVSAILDLLERQKDAVFEKLAKHPTHIVLVGGFGRNRYLYNRIKSTFSNMTVLQSEGQDPWTAICRGGVLYGLLMTDQKHRVRMNIGSRVARYSYGVQVSESWDSSKHLQEHRYWDSISGKWKAKGQMHWFIKKGDSIDAMEPNERPYVRNYVGEVTNKDQAFHISSETVPTPYFNSALHSELCTVEWRETIHAHELPLKRGPTQSYRQLNYNIRMTITGPSIEFAIIYQGKEAAKEHTGVEFPVKSEPNP